MNLTSEKHKIPNKYPDNILFEETVKSKSSNNVYSVIFFEKCVICTCPAGGKRMLCKHIIKSFHDNFELVKNKSPYLYDKLLKAIETKDNKELSKEEKSGIYKEIIFSNKEISSLSYKNGVSIAEGDDKEFLELEPILNSDEELAECFLSFLKDVKNDPFSIYSCIECDSIKKLIELGYLKKYDFNGLDNGLIAFVGNEILYTNRPIYKLANKLYQCEITSVNSKIKKIGVDYNIVLG